MEYAEHNAESFALSGIVRVFSPVCRHAGRVYSLAESMAVAHAEPGDTVSTADVEAHLEGALLALGCPPGVDPAHLEGALFGRVLGLVEREGWQL